MDVDVGNGHASIWVAQPPRILQEPYGAPHGWSIKKFMSLWRNLSVFQIPFVDGQNLQKTVQTAEILVKYAMR